MKISGILGFIIGIGFIIILTGFIHYLINPVNMPVVLNYVVSFIGAIIVLNIIKKIFGV